MLGHFCRKQLRARERRLDSTAVGVAHVELSKSLAVCRLQLVANRQRRPHVKLSEGRRMVRVDAGRQRLCLLCCSSANVGCMRSARRAQHFRSALDDTRPRKTGVVFRIVYGRRRARHGRLPCSI